MINRRALLTSGISAMAGLSLLPKSAHSLFLIGGGGTAAQQQSYGIFNVKDTTYGATGDGVMLADGAMASGSTTLTSATASFVTGDVGKVICVPGGGAAGVPLVTTIASRTNATTVVLTAGNASGGSISGKIVHYGTDDTTAIQAAITACANAHGGVVFFPAGIYIINGAFQNAGTHNGQLIIPRITAAPYANIALVGIGPTTFGEEPPPTILTDSAPHSGGSILFSPRNGSGTFPSLLSGWTLNTSGTSWNWTAVTLANLTFRTAWQSAAPMIAAQLSNVAWCHVDYCLFDVDATANQIGATQPVVNSAGLLTPFGNNGAYSVLRDSYSLGYDIGYSIGEHCDVQNTQAYFCYSGFVVGDTLCYHTLNFGRIGAHSCKRGIDNRNGLYVAMTVQQYSSDHNNTATHWFNSQIDVVDSTNSIHGHGEHHIVVVNTGVDNSAFNKTSATNYTSTALG